MGRPLATRKRIRYGNGLAYQRFQQGTDRYTSLRTGQAMFGLDTGTLLRVLRSRTEQNPMELLVARARGSLKIPEELVPRILPSRNVAPFKDWA